MGTGFWATLGFFFLIIGLIFVGLSGYHLAQNSNPVLYYLGYAMEFGACFIICMIMYTISEFFEKARATKGTRR